MGWIARRALQRELKYTLTKIKNLDEADREMIASEAKLFLQENGEADTSDEIKEVAADCMARRQRFAELGHFTKEWAVCAVQESIMMAVLYGINGDSKTAQMIHAEIHAFIENP